MLSTCRGAISRSNRVFNAISRRTILSTSFAIDDAWNARHKEIGKLGLGGDYEWISAVQKKFIGGGVASAVDVDAAVCVAEQKDQVEDVVELLYKLRHSENASDLAPSAEYALVRLLLRHDPDRLFVLAEDTINYGVFLNEHSACLAIDHFLKRNEIQGAARLSAWVMQQEMTSSELLNLLCLYSSVKWAELTKEEQIMPTQIEGEEEESEEEEKTFKFPYLKNESFDDHFDLTNPSHLAGKTLLWMARDCKGLDTVTRDSLRLVGAVLYDRMQLAASLSSPSIQSGTADWVRKRVEDTVAGAGEGATPTENQQKILDSLPPSSSDALPLSEHVLSILKGVQEQEEKKVMDIQCDEFNQWNQRRRKLVDAQAERVLLKIKMEELSSELSSLKSQEEKLSFFENRLQWEKRAQHNEEIESVPEEETKTAVA